MNNTFSTFSLETIKKQFPHQDLDSLEVTDWGQVSLWRERIEAHDLTNCLPRYIISPSNKDILSQFLKICCEHGWRILPLGNGTKLHWGKLPVGGDVLVSTHKWDQVIEHSVDDLTISVQSGMKISDLQDFLKPFGQFLPIDPVYEELATVGGVVATANTGSLRQRYGGVRDLILGISFLRSDGEEAKAGGKVVKNVAGYDLMKLFTGSYGNLGIITEVTFRLFPLPSESKTLLITGEKDKINELRKMVSVSGLTPVAADLFSESLISGLNLGVGMGLGLCFQGISESVEQQSSRIEQWALDMGLSMQFYQGEEELKLWNNCQMKVYQRQNSQEVVCKVGILPNKIGDFFCLGEFYGQVNMTTGIGQVKLNDSIKTHQIRSLRQFCEENSGYLTILESNTSLKQEIEPWGYVGNGLTMMKKIKSNFDRLNIFVDKL